jgi:REP-associated tyrosine transposase
VWCPKYRKRVLTGQVAIRVRDLLRQVAAECFKGTSARILYQESPHLKKQYWGRHLWARGYFAVTSGTITDEMINEYINEQEGEAVQNDSRFQIDPS